ncbi:hypothetical protein Pmar_PMAR011081 [Perkinsus marinus ATCC 50983]|uniref:Uncharacterized protein n=1 Tax=Perkinsus marinus (strain ATCC 50983 / TXsc) TaxID=423536 RepID=C5KVN3_PERM5|nr:hypothetical protein Pmar_PMAR011081 [Perkinsus marinus ATCC 50983]EER11418.1 hypothetical protein Pmar_PMAR011081 [Perkinsus marinus ATCC 50983]|eukprot:XP_002779623.1 hypothetical protein Pmar_PMAR011081 [Perkinsus marinus ATCC 50983]
MVPEDLPSITYRHAFVVIGRANIYSEFVKMVCGSESNRFTICRKSESTIHGGDSSVCESNRSNISSPSHGRIDFNRRQNTRQRRNCGNKCYCQIEAPPPLPRSVSVIRSRTSSLSLPQSPEPSCTSLSDSASRRWIQRSTIVSRVSFDNVSHKYSSYMPRLTTTTGVLNTALVFLLSLDPPPPHTKKPVAATNACISECLRYLAAGDSDTRSEWDVLMDDITMLELRLRQCHRMLDNCGKRFGKPLVCLVVLTADQNVSGRKLCSRRQDHRLAVEDLWRKWGPSGEHVLADRHDYEWNGEKLHSLVCDLSERLAQRWQSSSVMVL